MPTRTVYLLLCFRCWGKDTDMLEKTDALAALPFWEHLEPNQKQLALNNSSFRDYERGTLLHGSDTSCLGVVYLIKGSLRAYMLSDEGREITLFNIGEGESCVLSASCVINEISFETQLSAEEDCRLLLLNAGAFDELSSENIYARCFLFEKATERFSNVMQVMQEILFERIDTRLARFLLEECERNGELRIRMTQEKLAQNLSTAREVVARMLSRFAKEGMVELRRGEITITDKKALEELI